MTYFSENLSTTSRKIIAYKIANTRTYAQSVDKLWVTCDYSIYCGEFYTKKLRIKILKLWIVWKSLLICWYY